MGNQNQNQNVQTVKFVILFVACFLLSRSFFNAPVPDGPPRKVPPLAQAFKGLSPAQGQPTKALAEAELRTIDKAVGGFTPQADPGFWAKLFGAGRPNANSVDDYSYWARLRAGLLKQYVLKDTKGALELYNQVLAHNSSTDLHAQAIYQKGDLLWHTSKEGQPERQEAATTLEQLVHRGRGAAHYENFNIFVPQPAPSEAGIEAQTVLNPQSFKSVKVEDWRSTLGAPEGEGIADRVDAYYSKTVFHTIFHEVVRLFGNNPQYSYGLALLFFAVFLRLVLQPVTKKQYSSMKGMAEIAPEMKKIQDKYKDKPEKQMQMLKEVRELQAAHGVNPQLGCILAVVQIPIFIFVVLPLIQHYESRMLLDGASFLWIKSLVHPDIPLLVAYAISQFVSFRLSATTPTDPQQAQIQAIMGLVMPFTIPFFLKDYPSAFTLYWMMFNVISTIFQWRMMKANDPEKNALKTLFASPFPAAVPAAEALPARPGSKNAPSAKEASSLSTENNGFNGARSGQNGKGSKPVLTKISPQELNGHEQEVAVADTDQAAAARRAKRRRRRR